MRASVAFIVGVAFVALDRYDDHGIVARDPEQPYW